MPNSVIRILRYIGPRKTFRRMYFQTVDIDHNRLRGSVPPAALDAAIPRGIGPIIRVHYKNNKPQALQVMTAAVAVTVDGRRMEKDEIVAPIDSDLMRVVIGGIEFFFFAEQLRP